jgi:dTDP-4-dehydrorhamnose 3,5-epimerase-like enzyme
MAIQIIKLEPEFADERGFITRLLDKKGLVIKSVLYIDRKAGVISANHYHKKDTHFIFCLKGKVEYSEQGKNGKISSVVVHPGEMVKSSPGVAHSTKFLVKTTILAFSTRHRTPKEYEADTVRVGSFDTKTV